MGNPLRIWLFALVASLANAPLRVGAEGHRHFPHVPGQGMFRPDSTVPARDFRAEPMPGYGRMSPEERRQLRRDIQNAGEGLYRRPPPPQPSLPPPEQIPYRPY